MVGVCEHTLGVGGETEGILHRRVREGSTKGTFELLLKDKCFIKRKNGERQVEARERRTLCVQEAGIYTGVNRKGFKR